MLTPRQKNILDIVAEHVSISISAVKEHLAIDVSIATLNREISTLVAASYLLKSGKGRATSYQISPTYRLFQPINVSTYFKTDPDNRDANLRFDDQLFALLTTTDLILSNERNQLNALHHRYQENLTQLPETLYRKELERLTIELSWKSSQIEGNTYSLLETEQLFLEKTEAKGKSRYETTMLLNHKDALGYIVEHPRLADRLNLRLIEEIHYLLIKDLGVRKNIRSHAVGITGTAYRPLDNHYHITEAMDHMCAIINAKDNIFEKALLAVLLTSYIQPFEDGNKRTGRMLGNALLMAGGACPLSYRSVDAIEYKKAMLLFYEQHNVTAFKQLFVEQNQFSADHYFG